MAGVEEYTGPPIRQVDKYEVLATIGEGGMASVYSARLKAPGGASKRVALKLIHPHLSREPEFIRMFLDEMRVAMAMSHRNIVQTFDAGKYGESYYLVMEEMNRGSLSRMLRGRLGEGELLPLDIALFVASEVCAALDYAHGFQPEGESAGGVVHRDVSPGNILLSDHGDVKLADFGVAKVAGRITSSIGGMIKGKLTYMAPEQARGKVEPRSDLFSLGAVLYWMVAGVPLRQNPSLEEVRLGAGQMLLHLQRRRPEVGPSLEQLISRCLSPKLDLRPQSAAELRTRLAEELEWVQRRVGPGRDAHARLQEFLKDNDLERAGDPGQAKRLADAMMEMALAVPTRAGASASPPPEPDAGQERSISLGSYDMEAVTTEDTRARGAAGQTAETRGASRPRLVVPRGRGPMVLLGIGLLLAAALILYWLSRFPSETSPPVVDSWTAAAPGVDGAPEALDAAVRPPDRGAVAPGDIGRSAPARGGALPLPSARAAAAAVDSRELDRGVAHRPRPRRYGTLDLNASPWAEVYLGKRRLGNTPLQGVRLPTGRHRLRLVNPQRQLTARITVRIRAGRTTRRAVRLSRTAP